MTAPAFEKLSKTEREQLIKDLHQHQGGLCYIDETESDLNNPRMVSFTTQLPIEYLYHDASINPRSIVDLEQFIEEFYRGNPQLLPSLAHLDLTNGRGRVMLFDGQHKAAAQLFLGHR